MFTLFPVLRKNFKKYPAFAFFLNTFPVTPESVGLELEPLLAFVPCQIEHWSPPVGL